jgi:flagellin
MPTINTNVAAIKARSNLDKVQREMQTSIARLSSGKRITRAHDDAAGSAIAGRMESQIRGLNMSIKNAKDGQSFVDTAEGALQEISGILQRIRELAVQAGSGAMVSNDKIYLNLEVQALATEIIAIDANTTFNDQTVFTTTARNFFTDIDVNGTAIATPDLEMSQAANGVAALSYGAQFTIGSTKVATDIQSALTNIDTTIDFVNSKRANLGAISNRFDHAIDNLTNVVANTEAAQSRVEDADFAVETTQLTRNTVLQQAATAMVAQANASKNTVLALIQ